MGDEKNFPDLLRRVRSGDPDGITELVRDYEPYVRRAVRARLADDRLRRLFDSADVCQSVLASLCVRAALGQYELAAPTDLVRLLTRMARNKLANRIAGHRAECRDYRRTTDPGAQGWAALPATPADPTELAAAAELLAEAYRRLTPDERRVVELRQQGLEWADIATEVGGTAEGVRKQHRRGLDRVAGELGLEG